MKREDKKAVASTYGVLLCIKHLSVSDPHWQEFVDPIDSLFTKYPAVKIETMGFPTNWKDYLLE